MSHEQCVEQLAHTAHAAVCAAPGDFSRANLHLMRIGEGHALGHALVHARADGPPRRD